MTRLVLSISIIFLLMACDDSSVTYKSSDLSDANVYLSSSPYSDVIANCIRATSEGDFCTLDTLPFLGMDTSNPDISDIMNRVVVSHDWMGERFQEVLSALPIKMLPLFKAVTAIVIDDDIRPAYYTRSTAAIYLDPAYLWLSLSEKRSINPKEDFRAGFADDLNFSALFRYVKDGDYAFEYGDLSDNSTRQLEDITLLFSRLLLHELAHANDFMPPNSFLGLNTHNTPYEEISDREATWVSTGLNNFSPLNSETMFSLAQVMHHGEKATNTQKDLRASEVGEAFEPDGAAFTYAYASQFEDVAMMFEMSMMNYFYNVDAEVAFTTVGYFCYERLIEWGTLNRIGESHVNSRAEFITTNILNEISFDTFFQDFAAPIPTSGDWCRPTSEGSSATVKSNTTKKPKLVPKEDYLRPYL